MIKFEKYRIELNALQNPLACYNRLHPYKVGKRKFLPVFAGIFCPRRIIPKL